MLSNDTMIEIEINNHHYLQFRKLNELGIKHCITMSDLNFTFKNQPIEDNQKAIETVCNDLGFNLKNFSRPDQTHTNKVEIVKEKGINIYKDTDGIVTNEKDVPLGITTADCIPIVIYDEKNKVIANVHSGWKGTLNRILANTLDILIKEYNSNPDDLLVFFAPSICAECFEVENDVETLFEKEFGNKYITKGNIQDGKQKYYIDTISINIDELKRYNIPSKNVYKSNICTRHNHDKLHSYRYQRNTNTYGLGITIVTL